MHALGVWNAMKANLDYPHIPLVDFPPRCENQCSQVTGILAKLGVRQCSRAIRRGLGDGSCHGRKREDLLFHDEGTLVGDDVGGVPFLFSPPKDAQKAKEHNETNHGSPGPEKSWSSDHRRYQSAEQ